MTVSKDRDRVSGRGMAAGQRDLGPMASEGRGGWAEGMMASEGHGGWAEGQGSDGQ